MKQETTLGPCGTCTSDNARYDDYGENVVFSCARCGATLRDLPKEGCNHGVIRNLKNEINRRAQERESEASRRIWSRKQ